ncbi:hypothetical protein GCM10009853_056830 [Glycomyces scopariae]
MREGDRGGAVGIGGHERVEEFGVLLALAHGIAFDGEVEQPPHACLQRLHDLGEERVAGGGDEFAVERGVGLGAGLGVGAGADALLEPVEVARAGVRGGEAGGDGFEAGAHIEEVGDVLGGRDGDDAALAGDGGDEAVSREALEGFAQGDAGDLELGGEVAFDEAGAGAEPDGDDALAQRPVDLVGSAHVAPSAAPGGRKPVKGIPSMLMVYR